tara:strand:+ start:189 stop:509 length:321 start_codon:yes stop_codon:yes gene_type:complete
MLELTDSAIQHFLKETKDMLDPAIRVGIKGGGCSGFEYLIEYANEIKEDDNILDFGKFMIVIDPISQPLIEGSTLDFHKEAFNQNIKIANPNVEMACGCGVSVTFK